MIAFNPRRRPGEHGPLARCCGRVAAALLIAALAGSVPAEARPTQKAGAVAKAGAKPARTTSRPDKAAAKARGKPVGRGPAPLATAPPASTPAPGVADCNTSGYASLLRALPLGAAADHAQAIAFDRSWLRWPGPAAADGRYVLVADGQPLATGQGLSLARVVAALPRASGPLPAPLAQAHRHVGAGLDLQMPAPAQMRWAALLRGPLQLVEIGASGQVLRSTGLQVGALLDDLFSAADAPAATPLGARPDARSTRFAVWAPTAQRVNVCLHAPGQASAQRLLTLQRDDGSGIWQAVAPSDLSGWTYTLLVDVHAPGTGMVRNKVTDPYSLSLNTNSQRSWIGDLDSSATQPPGWTGAPRPSRVLANTDLVVYELHLRDFSASDERVPAALRGKYGAFTSTESNGMRHLRALVAAGVTDLHLLPVFDFATVPEHGCSTPAVGGPADGTSQQAAVMAGAAGDCYNWGYDPLHFGAPEGSYASDAEDGAVRIREFRAMVLALHGAGLRVGMDLVYNHTSAAGQNARSVLDRIVPGYYHRLNAQGAVETSSCCANTATERRMMARLMVDTAALWARDYRIDSMRFDLMGHQPRAAMERLQVAVDAAAGRHIHLLGEGWNFGEVQDDARFAQARQGGLNGSGIATFSDRGRDALRGGGCCDSTAEAMAVQGWLNGQFYAPNATSKATRQDLLRSADLARVGLAGTLGGYGFRTADGQVRLSAQIDYAGHGAGYASQPGEVVNYVENHDNPTLFDINVLKLPRDTTPAERARVQVLGLATTAFSQGVAYFHAGVELLRSKDGDRNSFDSGDWFNRIDWTAQTNHWGSGLPPEADNGAMWPVLRPLLADAGIAPGPVEIAFTRDAFFDLLKIRASSSLFRLRTADEVSRRLTLLNTGPEQDPTVLVGQLDGAGLAGAGFGDVLYAINANPQAAILKLPTLQGRAYQLHPVHLAAKAADQRPQQTSRWDASTATLTVPGRTALVYVLDPADAAEPASQGRWRMAPSGGSER